MNFSKPSHRRFAIVGAALAPVLLVQVLTTVLGSTPASAPAAGPQPAMPPPPIAASAGQKLTAEQERAAKWLADAAARTINRSPMDHPEPVAAPEVAKVVIARNPDAEAPAKVVELSPPPRMKFTAVMNRPDGALATINSRVCRVGDEISKGWTITAIDGINWVVTVAGPDDRTATLTLPR